MSSIFRSSKKKTHQKGRAFYDRENLIQTIDELIDILSVSDNKNVEKTETDILFHGMKLGNINLKTLSKDMGEESYKLKPENNIDGHEVHFFRMKSEHLKFLIQVHFINSEFFLAGTKVYSDALLSDNDKQRIVKQISDKYQQETGDSAEFVFGDPHGNILWTKDDVFFHINYLRCSDICDELKRRYYGLGKPKPGQNIKNTLDNII